MIWKKWFWLFLIWIIWQSLIRILLNTILFWWKFSWNSWHNRKPRVWNFSETIFFNYSIWNRVLKWPGARGEGDRAWLQQVDKFQTFLFAAFVSLTCVNELLQFCMIKIIPISLAMIFPLVLFVDSSLKDKKVTKL